MIHTSMQFVPIVRMLLTCILIAAPGSARADDAATVDRTPEAPVDQRESSSPEERGEQTSESDFSDNYDRGIKKDWSTYDLGFMTFRFGIFTLEDWGNAIQSEDAEQQIDVVEGFKVRDFRFSLGGKFGTSRDITYTSGIMYDGPTARWIIRETGIQIAFPELSGALFVGRQKEGISLSKATVGYAVWTMERTPFSDAAIPILADGVKWLGVLPSKRANFNFAYYYNTLPNSPSYDWYDHTAVGRLVVLPIRDDATGTLLHLSAAYRYGHYAIGEAQFDSKPESSTAPFFLDTGVFPADHDNMLGFEAYFRRGSWFGGGEYFLSSVSAPDVGDPRFHGGNVFMTWLMTGEQRPYIDMGGKVGFVKPKRSAFSGGPGALESVLNFSYADFDDADIAGGTFWRVTPELNWYLDPMASFRLAYGLGSLDRFGTEELHHFLQGRFEVKIQ